MPGRGGSFGPFGMSAGMDGAGPMMMEMGGSGCNLTLRPECGLDTRMAATLLHTFQLFICQSA